MFNRKCPQCKKSILFKSIKRYASDTFFLCPHCATRLTIKFSNIIVNSVILGAGTGALLAKFTSFSVEPIVIACALSGMFLQKYIDMFFSLEKYND